MSISPAAIGKRIADHLYIHLDWLTDCLTPDQLHLVRTAYAQLDSNLDGAPNIVKFNWRSGQISLLLYPDFEHAPFPELAASWTFKNGPDSSPQFRRYDSTLNPPLLHRKELLVGADHPRRSEWSQLTKTAEELGLFDEATTIGFRLNWERAIAAKGFVLQGGEFVPIGNTDAGVSTENQASPLSEVRRHLTALSRTGLSAPVQMLMRHGLLEAGRTFFDYGCGKGSDVSALAAAGFDALGWDPYFAPETACRPSDVVNLGFVINVIEDPVERVGALEKAFALSQGVLAIGVMLNSTETAGLPYSDGVLTSRQTFQKYFSQFEFKDYLEEVLGREAHMVAPGIALVFSNTTWEQHFTESRYRRRGIAERLLSVPRPPRPAREIGILKTRAVRPSVIETLLVEHKTLIDTYWRSALDLGRWPEADEISIEGELPRALQSRSRLQRVIEQHHDLDLLKAAAKARTDDLLVHFAAQQFSKRPPYKHLDARLQRDVKAFFGDYGSARAAAVKLLLDTGKPDVLLSACQSASVAGLGYLDGVHSLQLHYDLIEQLPAVLRIYIDCGLRLWGATSDVHVVKIHIGSGKLTLLEFDDFASSPLPILRRRIKVNLRRLDYDIFEYGSPRYPKTVLLNKSRFMHEEQYGYGEQLAFDDALASTGIVGDAEFSPETESLNQRLVSRRLAVSGMRLVRSEHIPRLDDACGENFTFRSFVECGETQARLGLSNLPINPASYNALYDLATQILDPVIEYFGGIRLTYGFCSAELSRHIAKRVAPKLDQHAACEIGPRKNPICDRLGAACDFIIDDENMHEVADWIIANLPFDRLYIYGAGRPIHVSYGPQHTRAVYQMVETATGAVVPKRYKAAL
jgi:DNA phosphorothioation-associated putative methyltransferase